MKSKILLFLVLLLIKQIAFTQTSYSPQVNTSKNAKYKYTSYQNDPLQSRWYVLPNGLTVILSVNKDAPRIQTLIATKAGSKSDPADNTGLAHYLEHMLFKGTDVYGTLNFAKEKVYLDQIDALYEKYNKEKNEAQRKAIYRAIDSVSGLAANFAIANEYDKMVQSIGAQGTNAFTSFEQTVYVNDIPQNQLDKWLNIEAERFRKPILRLFHTELEAVYEEKNRALDNDGRKVFESIYASLFKKHNYGLQTTIGTIEHLKNPSLTKIRNYYNTYYVPNNMAIILAGDFDYDITIDLIAKKFGYMKPKDVPQISFEQEAEISEPIVVEQIGPDAEFVNFAWRMPGAGTRESKILQLVDLILSNSKTGLLDLNLVKAQKVISAGASPNIMKDYSVHSFSGRPKTNQSLEEVKSLMLEQVENIKNGNFDFDLIKSIVLNNKVEQIQAYQSNESRAYTLLDNFVLGVDYQNTLSLNDFMLSVSKEDIINFAKKYYTNNYVVVYKRKGKAPESEKVEKPQITSVEVNRDKSSAFVTKIIKTPVKKINPVFLDYNKDIQKIELKNGIEANLVKNNTNDLFTLYYLLDIGKNHDKKLAFAINYLPFGGTANMTADAVSTAFYKLAANFGVSSSDKQTYVYLTGLNEKFDETVALFEDLLANIQPDQQVLNTLVERALKGRKDAKLNKGTISRNLRNYAIYGSDNPTTNILTEAELKALKAEDMCQYIHQLVQYPHKVLYFGPKNPTQLKTSLDKLHLSTSQKLSIPAEKKFAKRDITEKEVLFVNYEMVQAEIFWHKRGALTNLNSTPINNLFNEYFGGGMSSLVFQTIRESKALAYSTYAYYTQGSEKGDYDGAIAYVGSQADKCHDAIVAMNELLNTLPEVPSLLENSKKLLISNIETDRITQTNILFDYINAQKWGLSTDSRKLVYATLPKLKMTDLKNYHKTNLSNQIFSYQIVASKDKIDVSKLNQYGKVKELTLEEIFGY